MTSIYEQTFKPRICLQKIENGNHPQSNIWINAADELDVIKRLIATFVGHDIDDEAQGLEIIDSEDFGAVAVTLDDGLDEIQAQAVVIERHGFFGSFMIPYHNKHVESAEQELENHYVGCFESLADYARHQAEEVYGCKRFLAIFDGCVDLKAVGEQMDAANHVYWITDNHGVSHYFSQ